MPNSYLRGHLLRRVIGLYLTCLSLDQYRETASRRGYSRFAANRRITHRPLLVKPQGLHRKFEMLAGATGLEPAASCVTSRRSNQLNSSSNSTKFLPSPCEPYSVRRFPRIPKSFLDRAKVHLEFQVAVKPPCRTVEIRAWFSMECFRTTASSRRKNSCMGGAKYYAKKNRISKK
jgi:hypothetical protein